MYSNTKAVLESTGGDNYVLKISPINTCNRWFKYNYEGNIRYQCYYIDSIGDRIYGYTGYKQLLFDIRPYIDPDDPN